MADSSCDAARHRCQPASSIDPHAGPPRTWRIDMTVLPRAWTLRAFPLALAALVAGAPAAWAQQAPPVDPLEAAAMSVAPGRDAGSRHDDRAHPKGDVQRALKQRALQA